MADEQKPNQTVKPHVTHAQDRSNRQKINKPQIINQPTNIRPQGRGR